MIFDFQHNRLEYLDAFVSKVLRTHLDLDSDSLIDFVYEMREKNEKGVQISNVGGWQSDNLINEAHPEFVKLIQTIEEYTNVYHRDIQFKSTYKQRIQKIWANINEKGHSNEFHSHPNSALSGSYYLKVSSPIVFQHPYSDINQHYWDEAFIEEWNSVNSGSSSLEPTRNTLIIFPPWLVHKVLPNEVDADRISMSFNTGFV